MSQKTNGARGARRWWRRPVGLLVVVLGLALAASPLALPWLSKRRDPPTPRGRPAHGAWAEGGRDDAAAELGRAGEHGEPAAEIDRLWGLVYDRAGRPDDALPRLRQAWDRPGGGEHRPDPEVA